MILEWLGNAGKRIYIFIECMAIGSVAMVIAACYGLLVEPFIKH